MHYRLIALLAIPSALHAADVDVRVISTLTHAPMANAAVCLGTPANPDQFGARRTDAEGEAAFQDVPDTPLLLTVSKSQFKSERQILPANQSSRTISVGLRRGGGGPACSAQLDDSLANVGTGLRVAGFKINRGAASTANRTVTLDSAARGGPTHYRVSEHQDFRNADWRPYKPSVRYTLSPGPGDKRVYYQARRSSESSGASLQMLSNVASDSIQLTAP